MVRHFFISFNLSSLNCPKAISDLSITSPLVLTWQVYMFVYVQVLYLRHCYQQATKAPSSCYHLPVGNGSKQILILMPESQSNGNLSCTLLGRYCNILCRNLSSGKVRVSLHLNCLVIIITKKLLTKYYVRICKCALGECGWLNYTAVCVRVYWRTLFRSSCLQLIK